MKLRRVSYELSKQDIEEFVTNYLMMMNPESDDDPGVCCYQVPDDDNRPGIMTVPKDADEIYSKNEYDIIVPLVIKVHEDYEDYMINIDKHAGLTGLERYGLHQISKYEELYRIVEERYMDERTHIVDPVRLIEMMANRFKPFINYRGEHEICRVVNFDTCQAPNCASYNYCVDIEFVKK